MGRVSFFFARRLKEQTPEKQVSELLRDHTPLFYHALEYLDYETKWANPDCQWIMVKTDEFAEAPLPEFEERMYAVIKELAMDRARRFYPESVGIALPKDWNVRVVGSLKYDSPLDRLPKNYCNFHIANAVAPKSIFTDPAYLPGCFLELMARSEREYGYDTLTTATWLDDDPRWLALFPEEWHANLTPRKKVPGWDDGSWGQLVTARGTFNEKAGQYVRDHGELRYKQRGSHCSFEAMRKHLRELTRSGDK